MDLTESYLTALPETIIEKFEWIETRSAAAVLKASNPPEFQNLIDVLNEITLERDDILGAGGNRSAMASRIDDAFRDRGWREGLYEMAVVSTLRLNPWRRAGERRAVERVSRQVSSGYQTDNLKGRVAIDTEWNAKDGNLDRDLAAYRSLYDAAIIDAAVIITRTQDDMRALALELDPDTGKFATTTTTNLDKLRPRLTRGDGGGCPVLGIAIPARMYRGD